MRKPPEPKALAHWLLRQAVEGDDSPAALVAAAEAMHRRLRADLSIVFGQAGFDALWTRALALASRSVTEPASAGNDVLRLRAPDWSQALHGLHADEMRSIIGAALTSFIDLLFTFVGVELGSRLLHRSWPELPVDASSPSTGDSL